MDLSKMKIGASAVVVAEISEAGLKKIPYRQLKELQHKFQSMKDSGIKCAYVNQNLKAISRILKEGMAGDSDMMRKYASR